MKRTMLGLLTLSFAALSAQVAAQPGDERYYSGQASVTCESRNNGYRECYTGYRAPPQLVRQLSDSPCREGQSWGHRPGMVWVGRGCRATFQESRGWAGRPPGGGMDGSIICESRGGRYTECPARFRGPIDVLQQLSQSPCVEGRTWGQSRNGVWVNGGCRARFGEFYGGGGDGHWGPGTGYTTVCESRDNRRNRCDWDWNRGTPFLQQQLSHAPCVRNRSWGYDTRRQELWVDQGCRGRFGSR